MGIPEKKIKKNAMRCTSCNVILVSRHRHDFVSCKCGNFIDGGNDYVRFGGNFDNIELLTEYED